MRMFQKGPSRRDLLKKKQWHIAMTLRPVLPLAQTVQVKGELRIRVNGLMDFLRRLHEKTNQNIPRSSCQNNEAPEEKGVESITEIMGRKSLFRFNQERKGGGNMSNVKKQKFAVKCLECGKQFKTSSSLPECPKCNGSDIDLDYENWMRFIKKGVA